MRAPTVLLPAVLLVLFVLLPGTGVRAGGDAEERTVVGRPVVLAPPLRAPWRGGRLGRPLADAIAVGGARFPVHVEEGVVRLAEQPGGEARRRVPPGRAVRLTWRDDAGAQRRTVTLDRDEDGRWTWAPLDAWRIEVDGVVLTLVDADADGILGSWDADGVLLDGARHVLPLRPQVVVGLRVLDLGGVSADGSSARVTSRAIRGGKVQLEALELLNRLRLSHGLLPVRLDPELSRGCTEHAEYLQANGWVGTGSEDPHVQDPSRPKATPEGAAVAGASIIMKTSATAALQTHYRTYYHRIGIMHPRLTRVGINETVPSITVMDVYRGRETGPEGARLHAVERFCPADGAEGVPTQAYPEFPEEAVPAFGSRGWPLMVWFPEDGGPIADVGGEVWVVGRARRRVPVLAVPPDGRNVAGLVPERALRSGTEHEAVFRWTRGGAQHERRIRFRTR